MPKEGDKDPDRRHGPPHNPEVRDLISGKRRWSTPPTKEAAMLGFSGWHERGYLPHRDEPGLTQFITFCLFDAFPNNLRTEWANLLLLSDTNRRQDEIQSYLDKGRGMSWLRQPAVGQLVDQAIRFYHRRSYELKAWVVMPNHVHLLIKVETTPMSAIVRNLKRYTTREANKILHRQGMFWANEYWDTYMRDSDHELSTRLYIENNPTKAFLVGDPKDWLFSSARFRDEYGALCL